MNKSGQWTMHGGLTQISAFCFQNFRFFPDFDAASLTAHTRRMASRKKLLSREEIHALRGSIKRKPGDEQLTEANSQPSTCASWLTSFGGERLLLTKQFAPNKELLKRHAEKCLANS